MNRKNLFQISLFKSIYINFKAFSFQDAIKFPILVGRHTVIDIPGGGISIQCKPVTGMITIGIGGSPDLLSYEPKKNYIGVKNGGKLVFKGKAHFAPHVSILASGAEIVFGDDFSSNNGCRFSAVAGMEFGDHVLFGGNCVVRDSDGHTVYDLDESGKRNAHENKKPVKIGNHVWVANNSHILKGVSVADDTVIGYGSLVVNNLEKNHTIYSGVPAKVIRKDATWER